MDMESFIYGLVKELCLLWFFTSGALLFSFYIVDHIRGIRRK